MFIWIDAQFSPAIAVWIAETFNIQAIAVRELGLRDATDQQIFLAARRANAVIRTKDSDFLWMLDDLGPPPKVIWVTCGNTSNLRLKEILGSTMANAMHLLDSGEKLVEISDL